jgi:hypothetical protein
MIEAALVCGPDAAARRAVPRTYACRVVPTRRRWTELACTPHADGYVRDFSSGTEVAASG